MTTSIQRRQAGDPTMRTRLYDTVVSFLSNGDEYGREEYQIQAVDNQAAKAAAFDKAEDSIYFDGRIPDLARKVVVCRLAA